MTVRRISYFLDGSDEARLSAVLLNNFPALRFVDDNVWPSPEPPIRKTIEECTARYAFIWNSELFPEYKSFISEVTPGKYQAPQTRYVMQFWRCQVSDAEIHAGQVSASFEPSDVTAKRYTDAVFRLIKKLNSCALMGIDSMTSLTVVPRIPGYVVGAGAATRARQGSRLLPIGTSPYLVVPNDG